MRKYANANFSFAGLKTSVRLAIEANVGTLPASPPTHSGAAAAPQPTASTTPASGAQSPEQQQQQQQQQQPHLQHQSMASDPQRQVKADIAASFQHVATVHLVEKLGRAIHWARDSEPGLR